MLQEDDIYKAPSTLSQYSSSTYTQSLSAEPKKNGWQHFVTAFTKYAVFKGRARRAEYWFFTLFYFLISLAVDIVGSILDVIYVLQSNEMSFIGSILTLILSLVFFLPSLAVSIRRAHDTGRSGWYILIPIYGFVIMFFDSEVDENKYGPDPKGRTIIQQEVNK